MATRVILGSGNLGVEDLFAVAAWGYEVTLDLTLEEQLKRNESHLDAAPSAAKPSVGEFSGDALKEVESRAAVLGLCASLAHFLLSLLNDKSLPRLSVANPKGHVIALLFGDVQPTHGQYTAPALKEKELGAIQQSIGLATGCAALAQVALSNLLVTAECGVALSMERFELPSYCFDVDVSDASKVHAGEVTSAAMLRTLLADSKRCKAVKGKGDEVSNDSGAMAVVASVHKTHGTVRDLVEGCRRTIRVELCASFASSNSAALSVALSQLAYCANTLRNTAQSIASNGEEEVKTAEASVTAPGADVQSQATAVCAALSDAVQAIAEEVNAADVVLYEEEEKMRKVLEEKEAKQKAAEEKKLAALLEKEKSMTEEQRAKAAAKRAAKAKKAQEKTSKKSKSSMFGRGTAAIRAYFNARRAADGSLHIASVLSPFSRRGEAITASDDSADEAGAGSNFHEFMARTLELLGSGGARRKPKIAKGTRDFLPEQMEVREQAFTIIKNVFKRHGGVEIDTPVFELKETLLGKYGEEGGKLIYDLADQGGEMLCLRYDLTVPFARFLAMHEVGNIKRYHIAKVYRRDNPQISRGRYREFYQCDFDIAGNYPVMMADAEVLKIASEIVSQLNIGSFTIKLNHRVLLEAMMELCGVPSSKIKPICSAIDKLDKEEWSEVRREMVEDKGLDPAAADKIGEMVKLHGSPKDLLQSLKDGGFFAAHKGGKQALEELETLFGYLEMMGCLHHISFDLSLARGLHYYTGVIYEVVMTSDGVKVGSIAAGGRYDELVGMFSASGAKVPCVGVSIGIERIFALMEAKAKEEGGFQVRPSQVFVASAGKGMVEPRMKICAQLWDAGIAAEMTFAEAPKMGKQLNYALERGIPFLVTIGETEWENQTVQLKNLGTKEEKAVPMADLVAALKESGVELLK